MSHMFVMNPAHLIDDRGDAGVLVHNDLPDDVLVRQQLVADVQVCDVPDTFEGAGHLASRWQQPLHVHKYLRGAS